MLRFHLRPCPTHQPSMLADKHGAYVKYAEAEEELKRLRRVIEASRRALHARRCGVVMPEEATKVLDKFYCEERK